MKLRLKPEFFRKCAVYSLCASLILATCDVWTSMQFRKTWFSTNSWKLKDGGSTGHTGFLYSLVFWRDMDGNYGPEIWFWFTPVVISGAGGGVSVRWIW